MGKQTSKQRHAFERRNARDSRGYAILGYTSAKQTHPDA